jgi:hypothetical protein
MITPKRTSRCRILSIASPRQASAPQAVAMLALIGGQRVINLAELARAIAADRNLCCRVTQAACREFGWPWLNVEQAIVLLGREGLASQFLHLSHTNRNPAATNLRRLEPFPGEPE